MSSHGYEITSSRLLELQRDGVKVFNALWDAEGVYFYQAFRNEIAEYALKHQRFGGPCFDPDRMTWFKPSFAWVLYRSGYGRKKNQERVLRIKISHESVAHILEQSRLSIGISGSQQPSHLSQAGRGRGCSPGKGRVKWDPEREIMFSNGSEPRKKPGTRAIQVGVAGSLSRYYVASTLSIEDVTELAHAVGAAHMLKGSGSYNKPGPLEEKIVCLQEEGRLPQERPYMPKLDDETLCRLGMLP